MGSNASKPRGLGSDRGYRVAAMHSAAVQQSALKIAGYSTRELEERKMATEIAVMLAVSDAKAAVEFYKKAFGAEAYWKIGSDEHMVAGLAIGGARFFLATESPEFGTRGPLAAGF